MDKEFVKMIITTKDNKDERLIMSGDFIDNDLFNVLLNTTQQLANKAFYSYESNEHTKYNYDVEMKCTDCGCLYVEKGSKTAIFNTIRKLKGSNSYYGNTLNILCNKCLRDLQIKKEKEKKLEEEKYNTRVENDTEYYVENILNPDANFNDDVNIKDKIETVLYIGYADESVIKRKIQTMKYYDFLNTPYWEGIRCYKLRKADYKCELCATKGKLNVHHRTYKNHGLEHRRSVADKDLIVLCEKCHKKFHDILSKEVF